MGINGSKNTNNKKSKKDFEKSGNISSQMNKESDPLTAQVHRKYFDFGKPCSKCLKKNSKLGVIYSIYCLHCLNVKCLACECSSESDCNLFQSIVIQRVLELRSAIWKMIIDKRKNQIVIQTKCMLIERIHSTDVESTITISKRFETDDCQTDEKKLLENSIEICVKEVNDERNKNACYSVIRLDDLKYQTVGVVEKCGTKTEMAFINELDTYLKNEPVMVIKMDDCLRNLNDHDGSLILVCLHQSRIIDDVKFTLEGIECKHFKRILLVLLHFKLKDSDYLAKDIEKCYTDLQVIDYFQQENKNNIDEVLKQAKDFIF